MAFAPSSVVYLCNVDFDNGYKNVRYFPSEGARNSYFSGRVVRTFTEYLTVRKNKPDGGFVSSIKVGANIDDLMAHCNYMYYQNAHHGNRLFFAFITDFLYVNENTTEIVFETDVFQTWFHSVQIKPSFVVREHCVTNGWKDNLIPEKLDPGIYEYEELETVDKLNKWGYLVGATHYIGDGGSRGGNYSGVYQGLYFYYFTDTAAMNSYLEKLEEEAGDSVQFITLIPTFCVQNNTFDPDRAGILGTSSSPASADIGVPAHELQGFFGGVHCLNNKLQTYPYTALVMTNHSGEEQIYN